MIKKAQLKFIIITMSILLIVFALVFGGVCLLMNNAKKTNINNTLDRLFLTNYQTYLDNDEVDRINVVSDKILIISANKTPPNVNSLKAPNTIFTPEQIDYFDNIYNNPNIVDGNKDDFYYKVYKSPTDKKFLLVADMSNEVQIFNNSISLAFIVFISVYAILFFVVWLSSYKVFQPIKDSFNKQKQFISNASHELKTPLSIISANTDVLKTTGNNQWIDSIKSQTERMNVLVEDMLTLAKMEEKNIVLSNEEFNLTDTINSVLLPFDAVTYEKQKTLELNLENNVIYKGDINSVKKLLNILIDNAIKYSSVPGVIRVTLKAENNKKIITVFNTGSSVKDEESNRIFERFFRADNSRSRETGGSGLGLAIAKNICEDNKWKISALSKFNKSMTITIVM